MDIPLGYTSWVTCIPLTLHHRVCYPRGMHAPKRCGLPEMQSKRHAQEACPRRMYLLGYMYTSWAYLLSCMYASWVACLLGTPLGLHHTSWVAGDFTDVVDDRRSPVKLVVLMNTSTMVEGNSEVSTREQHNPREYLK